MEQTYQDRTDDLSEMERDILNRERLEREEAVEADILDVLDIDPLEFD
jgi:hypothetical protein